MRAPLSVILPTSNSAVPLRPTLACLMEGLENGLVRELVLVDHRSTDATRDIADEVGAIWADATQPGWPQIFQGLQVAQGDWVLMLTPGATFDDGWAPVVWDAIQGGQMGYFRRASAPPAGLRARVSAVLARMSGRRHGPTWDQGRLWQVSKLRKALCRINDTSDDLSAVEASLRPGLQELNACITHHALG